MHYHSNTPGRHVPGFGPAMYRLRRTPRSVIEDNDHDVAGLGLNAASHSGSPSKNPTCRRPRGRPCFGDVLHPGSIQRGVAALLVSRIAQDMCPPTGGSRRYAARDHGCDRTGKTGQSRHQGSPARRTGRQGAGPDHLIPRFGQPSGQPADWVSRIYPEDKENKRFSGFCGSP